MGVFKNAAISKILLSFVGSLTALFIFTEGLYTPDAMQTVNLNGTYDQIENNLRSTYKSNVDDMYTYFIEKLNEDFSTEDFKYELTLAENTVIPESYSDNAIGSITNEHCNIEVIVNPSLSDMAKMVAIYYMALNDQMANVPYGVLVGDKTKQYTVIYPYNEEDLSRYETIKGYDFYNEIKETKNIMFTVKDPVLTGYDQLNAKLITVVTKEAGCEYLDENGNVFDTPDGGPGQVGEIHSYCWPEETEQYYEVSGTLYINVYLDFNDLRTSEVDNMINYYADIKDSESTYEIWEEYTEQWTYKFENLISLFRLEEEYERIMLGTPYGVSELFLTGEEGYDGVVSYLGDLDFSKMKYHGDNYEYYNLIWGKAKALKAAGLISGATAYNCTELADVWFYNAYGYDGLRGNGGEMARNLLKDHSDQFYSGKTPAPGAIISIRNGSWGHVVCVDKVDSSTGKMWISEGNFDGAATKAHLRTGSARMYYEVDIQEWMSGKSLEIANPRQ